MNPNIILLGIVSLLTDLSSDMIMPILPLFIKSIGGAGIAIGLINGLSESISSILKVFSGYWSDKIGKRKFFVFIGYGTSAIAKLFFPLVTIWQHFIILRPIERVGKGIRTAPRDAIIASSVEKEKRGKGFGIHRAMDSLGGILGAILAFIFFWYLGLNFRTIFLIAAVFAFLALIPIFFVKEKSVKQERLTFKVSLKKLSKPLKYFIIIASIFALGNFSYMFFILKAQESFNAKLAIGIPILLYVLFNIFYTVFSVPAGVLSDKIGRKKVLLIGYSLFGLTSLGFALFDSLISFIILFIFYGLVYAFIDATERAYVSDLAAENIRGTALGTFHTSISLATLPSGIVAGLIWDINPSFTFIFGSVMAFLAVGLFGVLVKK